MAEGRLLGRVDLLGPLDRAILVGSDELPGDLCWSRKCYDQLLLCHIGFFHLGERVGHFGGRHISQRSERQLFVGGELASVSDHFEAFEHEKTLVGHDEAGLLFGVDGEGEVIASEHLGVWSFPHVCCDFCGSGGDNIWFWLNAFGPSLVGIQWC